MAAPIAPTVDVVALLVRSAATHEIAVSILRAAFEHVREAAALERAHQETPAALRAAE